MLIYHAAASRRGRSRSVSDSVSCIVKLWAALSLQCECVAQWEAKKMTVRGESVCVSVCRCVWEGREETEWGMGQTKWWIEVGVRCLCFYPIACERQNCFFFLPPRVGKQRKGEGRRREDVLERNVCLLVCVIVPKRLAVKEKRFLYLNSSEPGNKRGEKRENVGCWREKEETQRQCVCVCACAYTRWVRRQSDKEAAKNSEEEKKSEDVIREREKWGLWTVQQCIRLSSLPSVRRALNPFIFRTIALFLKSFRAECLLHPADGNAAPVTQQLAARRPGLLVRVGSQRYRPLKTLCSAGIIYVGDTYLLGICGRFFKPQNAQNSTSPYLLRSCTDVWWQKSVSAESCMLWVNVRV